MRGVPRDWLIGLLAVGLWGAIVPAGAIAQPPTWLIGKQETWKYSASPTSPPGGWDRPEFDDSSWKSGKAGFGYGDSDDETVLDDMPNRYTAVYIRKSFDLERPGDLGSLYLYINYDDGFIAYLNGKRVASAAVARDADGVHVEQHEARGFEAFEIRDAKSLLKPGRNVLAIEGHNVSPDSSDFSLDPALATRRVDAPTTDDYLADVDELERRLLDQSSYLTRLGFDHRKALAGLRHSIDEGMDLAHFVAGVRGLVMQIGDCHASVESGVPLPSSGFLPIRPADTADGVAALKINQARPLDPECPYLESIDGEPLGRWLEAAARYVPRGSPQLVRRRSLEGLGQLALLREELKLAAGEAVTIGLRSADGSKHSRQRLRPTNQGYGVAHVGLGASRLLDGKIGYLRIPAMDDRLIEHSAAMIESFRGTKGLIIDVRDNGGGTYGVMRGIYGFFVAADATPRVTNIAAYRLAAGFARDHIEYRPTYRADWPGWDDQERDAIRRALAAFRPEWQPPQGQFSDWHFMILGRKRSGRDGADRGFFHYDKPVVVLSDAGSFSATDGFLNAFADLPGVTIVGEPSGGGSGATRSFLLPRTRVQVALSSMASFRPDGRLFDGHGIEVDVAARPRLADYTTGEDSVLARGIGVIVENSR